MTCILVRKPALKAYCWRGLTPCFGNFLTLELDLRVCLEDLQKELKESISQTSATVMVATYMVILRWTPLDRHGED